jgi:hypothetical protein
MNTRIEEGDVSFYPCAWTILRNNITRAEETIDDERLSSKFISLYNIYDQLRKTRNSEMTPDLPIYEKYLAVPEILAPEIEIYRQ